MSITAIVENDTIKLPTHVPNGTRVEILLPEESAVRDSAPDPLEAVIGAYNGKAEATGRSASAGQSFYEAAREYIGMFEGPRNLSTSSDPFDAVIGAFNGKAEATGRRADEILYGPKRAD